MNKKEISVFWFRRDLRLDDNVGLHFLTHQTNNVLPLFIFDSNILDSLAKNDRRVSFIHQAMTELNEKLRGFGSGLKVLHGNPIDIWNDLTTDYNIKQVYFNHDYEPEAIKRDQIISNLLTEKGIEVCSFKDHVIFEKGEITKPDGNPYTVYTPYSKKWLAHFKSLEQKEYTVNASAFYPEQQVIPSLKQIGFIPVDITAYQTHRFKEVKDYQATRDIPSLSTTRIGHHLRFGTISIRKVAFYCLNTNRQTLLGELIWRDFFIQILAYFPHVTHDSFKAKYDQIQWLNNPEEFKNWCEGKTGYPLVDAGMKELVNTGFMHNRVRMLTASFLTKHLLIDWRWGERFFAEHLMDYELASNNGNWQWAAGTGCDAAPYFRIFNPMTQQEKFDPEFKYTKKFIPDFKAEEYISPIVDHKKARERCISTYKYYLNDSNN